MSVSGGHDNDVGAGLHAVHEGEELGNNTALDLSVGLLTLGGDGVDLINEDDSRRVLLGLLEGLAKVGFGFTSHLGHDLGTVDQEEESTGLVGDGTSHQGLTGTGRTVHEDTTRGLDTDGLEELGMTERQLDQFTDLSHLLAATTDIVVTNLVEVTLLILALDGLALAVNNCVLGNNAVLWRVDLHNLKLDLSHTTSYCEQVTLADWSVGLAEVGSEVDIEERTGKTFDGIGNREDSNALGLFQSRLINGCDKKPIVFNLRI